MAMVVFLQEDGDVLSVYRNLKIFVKRPPTGSCPYRVIPKTIIKVEQTASLVGTQALGYIGVWQCNLTVLKAIKRSWDNSQEYSKITKHYHVMEPYQMLIKHLLDLLK